MFSDQGQAEQRYCVDDDDLASFLEHSVAFEAELLALAGHSRRQRDAAIAVISYEPEQDSSQQLAGLHQAARTTSAFVSTVWQEFNGTATPLSPASNLLGFGWPWSTTSETTDGADAGGGLSWRDAGHFWGNRHESPSNVPAGGAILNKSFADFASAEQIATDEFEMIVHENGNVTLVLPGVIDLSSPHLGFDPVSRSSRDLDQVAIGSAFASNLDDNVYGQMVVAFVAEGIDDGLIDEGANVLIVGHSFGADTAFDLAASSEFNGELVNVTHMVAAGYHNEPQLGDVPDQTKVAVLQNIYDVPVIAEGIVADLLPQPLKGRSGNRGSGFRSAARVAIEIGERAAGLVVGVGQVSILGDRVEELDNSRVLVEFEGGLDQFGHHPDHYAEYLNRTNPHPAVSSFVEDLDHHGYGQPGRVLAVDVSLPDRPSRQDEVKIGEFDN